MLYINTHENGTFLLTLCISHKELCGPRQWTHARFIYKFLKGESRSYADRYGRLSEEPWPDRIINYDGEFVCSLYNSR